MDRESASRDDDHHALRLWLRLLTCTTLIENEVIELLAAHAGVEAQVAAITDRAMRGELDFQGSFRRRVAMLKGLPVSTLQQVVDAVPLLG